MDNLVFRVPPDQLRYTRVGAAVLASVTVVLAAIAYFRPSALIGVLTFSFALGLVMALWANVTSPRAFTECSPDGIRARGLLGFRIRSCPWAEVDKISVVDGSRGTSTIMVTRHDGSRFRLGVPSSPGNWPDRDFGAKFARISSYRQEVAPHGVPDLPPALGHAQLETIASQKKGGWWQDMMPCHQREPYLRGRLAQGLIRRDGRLSSSRRA